MFGFRNKDKSSKLQKQYERLMRESFELSRTNRAAGDKKAAEAEEVLKQIEALKEA